MKVVYISNSIIPSKQANSVHVMQMAQAFAKKKLEITLIAIRKDQQPKKVINDYLFYGVQDNFTIIKLPRMGKIGGIIYAILSLFKIIKLKPDFVYGRCLIGIYFASLFGFKTMYEAHAPFYNQHILKRSIFKKLIANKNFKGLVVISDALKNIFLATENIKKGEILVAHDGADIVDLEEKILLNTTRLQVGYVGHLYKGRGIDVIIEIASILTDVDFHIIGGNARDINYWESKNQSNNVVFHGYFCPAQIHKYRNSFDVLLAPYQNVVTVEGKNDTSKFMSPLKIFEYMASKKVIISSDLPVLREVLNENNAVLVECDNVISWANAIKKMRDPNVRSVLANQSYQDFKSKYTWTIRAEKVISRFKNI